MYKRVAFLDCARSLCMLFIVAYWHIYAHFSAPAALPDPWGGSISRGVLAAFFFISAYFLGKKPIDSVRDALVFYKKRLLRFYPLYFLSCTSLLLIHYLWRVDYISSFRQYALSLLGLSCFLTPAPKTIWFVSMLIPFYLVTPLINACRGGLKKAACCALLFIAMWTMGRCGVPIDYRLALYFPVYSAGLILGSRITMDDRPRPLLLAGGLAIFCAGVLCFSRTRHFVWHYPTMAGFIPFVIEAGKLLTRPRLLSRAFGWISYGSMAAYLFHRQLLGLPLVIMGKLPVWFFYLIILPALLAFSWLIQFLYDRSLDCIMRQPSPRRQTAIPSRYRAELSGKEKP